MAHENQAREIGQVRWRADRAKHSLDEIEKVGIFLQLVCDRLRSNNYNLYLCDYFIICVFEFHSLLCISNGGFSEESP